MINTVKLISGLSTSFQKLSFSSTSYCCRRFNRNNNISTNNNTDKPMERKFTFVQMKQIKHMYYEDPETWNYDNLAAQFDTDYETIRRIVKKKNIPSIDVQRELDSQVLGAKRVRSLEENLAEAGYYKKEVVPVEPMETSSQSTGEFKANWFSNYTKSPHDGGNKPKYKSIEEFTTLEEYLPDQELEADEIFGEDDHHELFVDEEELDEEFDEDLIEELEDKELDEDKKELYRQNLMELDEDEKELYRQNLMELDEEEQRLYRQNEGFEEGEVPEEELYDEDDVTRESQAFRVVTQDGVNYYDEQGRFLYKIA